jgi:hypothetical protein
VLTDHLPHAHEKHTTEKKEANMSTSVAQRITYPYEAVRAFMALDRKLNKRHLIAQLWIHQSGYAFVDWSTPGRQCCFDTRHTIPEVRESITHVADDLDIPVDWPTMLCPLFPPEVFSTPRAIDANPDEEQISLIGKAVQVIPASPADVLWRYFWIAEYEEDLLPSLRNVARAAGLDTAEAIEAKLRQMDPEIDLPEHVMDAVRSMMTASSG